MPIWVTFSRMVLSHLDSATASTPLPWTLLRQTEVSMPKVKIDAKAPDFALEDFRGNLVELSQFQGEKHVVLVFNRGFL